MKNDLTNLKLLIFALCAIKYSHEDKIASQCGLFTL